jgi:hypothetical protein
MEVLRMTSSKPKVVSKVRYTLDDKTFDLDIGSITLGERIEAEDYLGMPWGQAIGSEWFLSEKTQAFLAFLAMRRRKPSTTLDEVLEARALEIDLNPSDPPTKPASKRTRKSNGSQA